MAVGALLGNARAVFFDAVGTIIHPDPGAAEVYAAVGRRFGSRLSPSEVRTRFVAAFRRQEERDIVLEWRTREEREHERWQTIVAEVLDDVTDAAGCFQELYRHFSLPAAWRHADAIGLILEMLSRRGYALGVASNYDHRLRSVLAGLAELALLKHVVISSEVGWRKPSPHFFAAVCRAVGLPAAQIVLVGDDRVNDYDGALAIGMRAILLDRTQHTDDRVPRIQCLEDLLHF